jgi:hypothetical protein
MRTSFLHLADARLGFRDSDDPEVFQKVAKQFRFAVDFAVAQRVSFVVFSGQMFVSPHVEPDALHVAMTGLSQLAAKNITAIAVRGRCELSKEPSSSMNWHDLLAQEGLLASLEVKVGDGQLELTRWERREGRGSFVDLGRCRVFGLHFVGSMAQLMLPALAKAIGGQDNREADFRLVLLPGLLEHFSTAFGAKLAYSDVLMLRRHLDYVALGGGEDAYESEGWVYNPGSKGFYHVTVDTAVQPKHQAHYVPYPAALHVVRPDVAAQRVTRREQEERIFDGLVGGQLASLQRDVVRLVTQTTWGASPQSHELRVRLLEAAAREPEQNDAA